MQIKALNYLDGSPIIIEINEGVISGITRLPEDDIITGPRVYVAPGFFDNQVNGYAGVSFGFGGSELTAEGVHKATQALWKDGVTTYLATLTTNSHEILLNNLAILAKAIKDPENLGSIAGIHLEGPYISPIDGYRGAHPAKWVRKPDIDEFKTYIKAANGHIVQLSLAPEIDGAMELIRFCRKNNIVVALAHHNASADAIKEAIDNGAVLATHIGNGCANMINRHQNPLWPQLADDRLSVSMICDGFHLRPEEMQVFYKVKGNEKTIIVSDVTHYAALTPGEYVTAEGETIELTPEGMLRLPVQNVLYGSASPITKGVGHIMGVTGCTLAEAVRMASTNPAEINNIRDRGRLLPGMRADLVLFTLEGETLHINKTLVQGQVVYEAE